MCIRDRYRDVPPGAAGRGAGASVHLEVGGEERIERVAQQFDAVSAAESPGLAPGDRSHERGVEAYHAAIGGVHGHGVVRDEQDVHGARVSSPRAVALHGHDPVPVSYTHLTLPTILRV